MRTPNADAMPTGAAQDAPADQKTYYVTVYQKCLTSFYVAASDEDDAILRAEALFENGLSDDECRVDREGPWQVASVEEVQL